MTRTGRKSLLSISLSMRAKLMLGFSVILLIFAGVSTYQLFQAQQVKQQIAHQNQQVDKQFLASALKLKANQLYALKSNMIISKKSDIAEQYQQEKEQFMKLVEQIAGTAGTSDERKWSAKLTNTSKEFTAMFDDAYAVVTNKSLSSADMNKQLESLHEQSQVHKEYIFELTDQFNQAYSQNAAAAVASSEQLLSRSSAAGLISLISVVLVTAAVAILIIQSFMKPIHRLQHAVKQIAGGDLRHKINNTSSDELGRLSQSFDHMVDQVNQMLRQTQRIASSLSGHSRVFHEFSGSTAAANKEIVRAIQEISAGAEQQAEHSEHSAHIITDLEKEIAEITDYTQTMQRKSREAAFNTHTGLSAVNSLQSATKESEDMLHKVYVAMETLSASSAKIASIVNTITEISTQTNVLSLNAAIEAARAGEHGKGFSVIAEEVRQLSAQTNESSKSIGQMLSSVTQQMRELGQFVSVAQSSFHQQKSKVNETMEAFSEIRVSMDELSEQIDRIHARIDDTKQKNERLVESVQLVSAIAQQTAAGVEEVNSTSTQQDSAIHRIALQADDILALSDKLFQEISRFQISDEKLDESTKDTEAGSGEADSQADEEPQTPAVEENIVDEEKKQDEEEKKLILV
jgi:methyl-accepting chemotaxis protein